MGKIESSVENYAHFLEHSLSLGYDPESVGDPLLQQIGNQFPLIRNITAAVVLAIAGVSCADASAQEPSPVAIYPSATRYATVTSTPTFTPVSRFQETNQNSASSKKKGPSATPIRSTGGVLPPSGIDTPTPAAPMYNDVHSRTVVPGPTPTDKAQTVLTPGKRG